MRFTTAVLMLALFVAAGCGRVTYPKEKIAESVVELCRKEYGIDIESKLVGETLTVYLPIQNLFDVTLNINEKAQEKIRGVLWSASRIALSTDADIRFYCIITQDVRIPQVQFVIIKYTDDLKRSWVGDISRGEYFKRTIMDLNENPQAKKEEPIREVFRKKNLDKKMQEKILDDFFRSPPASLDGIGYWQGEFYTKDIKLPEFMAEQMAGRIKKEIWDNEDLKKYGIKGITGKYIINNGIKIFLVSFRSEALLFTVEGRAKSDAESEVFGGLFGEMADVVYAYKFEDFDLMEILELSTNRKLVVPKDRVYLFECGEMPLDAILAGMK